MFKIKIVNDASSRLLWFVFGISAGVLVSMVFYQNEVRKILVSDLYMHSIVILRSLENFEKGERDAGLEFMESHLEFQLDQLGITGKSTDKYIQYNERVREYFERKQT